MSARFSGAGEVTWDVGGVTGASAWTSAILIKLNAGANSTWHSMFNTIDGADAVGVGMTRRGTANTFTMSVNDEGAFADGPAFSSAQGWTTLVASRPGGTGQTVAYTMYPVGGSPTSGNMSGTLSNASAAVSLQFGNIHGVDDLNGWVAAIAWWNTQLNQTQRELLGSALTREDWLTLVPAFLVDEIDQFEFDYVSETNLRTSITGVTDEADDPAGWEDWAPAEAVAPTYILQPPQFF